MSVEAVAARCLLLPTWRYGSRSPDCCPECGFYEWTSWESPSLPVTIMPEPQVHSLSSSGTRKPANVKDSNQEKWKTSWTKKESKGLGEACNSDPCDPECHLKHTGRKTLQTRQPASPGPWASCFRSLLAQRNNRLPLYAGQKGKQLILFGGILC